MKVTKTPFLNGISQWTTSFYSDTQKITFINDTASNIGLFHLKQDQMNKGLESDPFNSPPAQEHFTTILNFH